MTFTCVYDHTLYVHCNYDLYLCLLSYILYSYDICLFTIMHSFICNIDQGNITGLIYIDLKKDFDTVNHTIVIQKLAAYGVRGTRWNLVFFLF